MPDIPGDSSTTATISVGGTVSSTLETLGDHDWFRITLTAGQSITVFVDGTTLEDSYLRIRNAAGTVIFENDDISLGVDRDSRLSFSAPSTGTYYIDVGAFDDAYTGDYQVSVSVYTPPPLATYDQIANQLTSGYWAGDTHHFNVTQGGSITVNITALTPGGQTLARAALTEWSDIIGVNFTEVTTGGQITFDDNQPGAATDGSWSGGIISSEHVNISTQWLANYGMGLNSYSFQTYIHEIGHALGLGHAGNYNGSATYPYDALFQNDAWVTSIMSYFSPTENTYFAGQGFTENFVVTPEMADILAMSSLYGLSTTTRVGDTTYGFHSTAGNAVYDANQNPGVAYTIFDSGGNDTLDYSGFSTNQLINLNAETFSSVGPGVGNVAIARGVVIENAIGGSGNDTITANAANNSLAGGAGEDTVSYATASAGVTVNLGISTQQNTGGSGLDTLTGFEHVIGSAFGDTLIGGASTMSLTGGAGNDLIQAGAANAPGGLGMYGGDGDDVFTLGPAADWVDGGPGFDIVDCSAATGPVVLITNGHAGASMDTLNNVEEIIGSNYADTLYAWNIGDVIIGGAGDDTLSGSPWGPSQLTGGTGNDTYIVNYVDTQVSENAGEGTDTVQSQFDYVLGANVENLTLTFSSQANGTGNSLDNVITGNSAVNVLNGNDGNDTLNGGAGADTLIGGLGNDVFVVDQLGDVVVENAGQGTDTVVAKASYALGAGVEVEVMTTVNSSATTAINLTGNEFAQSLYGNAGNNILTGGGGADYMVGGAGNDWYYVDTSDFIAEANGGGDDTIEVATSYILREGNEIETLVALNQDSTDPVDLTGNEYGQSLYGSQGVNSLNGGAGNDYLVGLGGNDFLLGGAGNDNMAGGQGNDIYYVDSAGDQIFENAGEGDDLAVCFASFALGAGQSVETLSAAEGSGAINLTGNALGQSIYGNSAANVLTSGGGADYMVGGAGNDVFVLTNAPGVSTIGDYSAGDVVDITQYLSVANGTDVVTAGYVKIVGTQLQVDANGGGDNYVTIGSVSGSGSVTIRYQSGGNATDLSVSRSASQSALMAGAIAAAGLAALVPADKGDGSSGTVGVPADSDGTGQHSQAFSPLALDAAGASHPAVIAPQDFEMDGAVRLESLSLHLPGEMQSQAMLDGASTANASQAPAELLQGTQAAAHTMIVSAMPLAAAAVIMPAAAMLEGLSAPKGVQHDQIVGQVLADALAGGAPSHLDTLLNTLPVGHAAPGPLAMLADPGHAIAAFGTEAAFATPFQALGLDSFHAFAAHFDAPPAA